MNGSETYTDVPEDSLNAAPRSGSASDRLDLGFLRVILRRRLRLFLYTAVIIFNIAALLAVWLPPSYTATAVIVLNASDVPVTPSSNQQKSDEPASSSDVETEMAIVTSREIAMKVVDYLKLDNDPDMQALLQGGMFRKLAASLGIGAPPLSGPLSAEDRAKLRQILASVISQNLDVERVSSAYAISVGYTDSNPIRATAIANAIAHTYRREQIALKAAENAQTAGVLSARIEKLRQQAQADFEALQRYRIENNLLSTTGATMTEQEISAYNQQVATAQAGAAEDRARLNTALNQLQRGSTGDDVGEALESPVIQSLKAKRAELSTQIAAYGATLGPKNPDFMDALRQLADVDAQIRAETSRLISNLDARAKVSAQRVGSLSGSLNSARSTLAQNNEAMVKLDDLQRRANTSQALYESYLNSYKEAVAASGAERATSRLISDARIPGAPSFPKPSLFLLLGAILGIGAGLVAALVAELSFTGLTTGEDVRRRLGMAYLGGIPDLKSVNRKAKDPLAEIRNEPRGAFAEAVKGVLTRIRQTGTRNQVVMISSALPNEGKTTTSACLAQSAARGGERVVVIDCDNSRRQFSRLHTPGAEGAGLLQVLSGEVTIAAAVRQDEATGFAVIPLTGPADMQAPPLNLVALQSLVAQLREHFHLIVLDCPPVLPVAEAREIAGIADRILMVGQWRKTSEKALLAAIDLLPPGARSLAGVALSKIDMKKQSRFAEGDAEAFYQSYEAYYHA